MTGTPIGRVLRPLFLFCILLPPSADAQQVENRTKPWLRQEYFREQRAYPFGEIPAGALQRARRELRVLQQRGLMPLSASGRAQAWESLGPTGIPWSSGSIGRLTTIALHPTQPGVLYIGGAQGGVWKTTNGGVSWTPLTDGTCSLAMGSLAIDPVTPEIVYAGTGELHYSGDSYYGCGVLRSTDGGATWTELAREAFGAPGRGARTSNIVIDPATAGSATATTVYAATDQGLWRSRDSGGSWQRVLEGYATALVVDPSSPSTLYAGLGYAWPASSNGVYKSTDGGSSWTKLGGGLPGADNGRVELAIAPNAPSVLYASFQDSFDGGGADGTLLGIWRSTNGGASWTKLAAANASCGTQCWYDQVIRVHPTDPSTVIFGGVALYRSTDGGTSFQNILGGIHVDQHAFVFDPADASRVYVGNDGGIYRGIATPSNVAWTSLNTNLAITQFYPGISMPPIDEVRVLGGTQDNGTLEYGGDPTWAHVMGADGGFTANDFEDPGVAYAEIQWGHSSSGPRRRDGANADFQLKNSGIVTSDRALFIPPLVMSPTNPKTLYFGSFRLYRTRNRADSWTPISGDLTLGGSGRISAIAPAVADSQTVWVGASDGSVQVTRNGGATWTLVSQGRLPRRYVTDLAVHPGSADRAYVTFSGFNSGHVFRTRDGGATWVDISANLPDVPVNAIVAHPLVLYIGTDLGVFRSLDDGGTWEPHQEGLPNVAVFDMAFHPRSGSIVAATHGRGMFVLGEAVPAALVASVDLLSPPDLLVVEERFRMEAQAIASDGRTLGPEVLSWRSSDRSVSTVDAEGTVTAVAPGTATITVSAGGRSDSAQLQVHPQSALAFDIEAVAAPRAPARAGARVSLLALRLSAAGHEAVRVRRLGLDARGAVPGARVLLIDDVDADGRAGEGEPVLTDRPISLVEGEPARVELNPSPFVVEPGETRRLVVALSLPQGAPHDERVQASLARAVVVAGGVRSGLARLEFPADEVLAVTRTSVLEDDEVFALSENPVRGSSVIFSFGERPTVAGVYALDGRRVADLLRRMDGDGRVDWDLRNDDGARVASGVYLVIFEVGGEVVREKLLVAPGGGGTRP